MRVEIRPAIVSDVDALAALERATFSSDRISRRSFRALVERDSAALLVATVGADIAGYCVVLFRAGAGAARLYSIAVATPFAGQGIGRLLLAEAERVASARGCRVLRLEVRLDNEKARILYEKAGYALFGRHDSYYSDGQAALRFERSLPERESRGRGKRHAEPGTAR
ncbi:MAG: GNAT family N-acetyltransferase [Rhizobiaceae bacterium]